MGTHPIFESDFDCLTEMFRLVTFDLMGTLIRPKQSVGVQYATALHKLYPNRTFDANIIHHNFYKRKAFILEQIIRKIP